LVIDIIKVLTESSVPKRYWSDLKKKLSKEGSQAYDKIVNLKMIADDEKKIVTSQNFLQLATIENVKKFTE
jgi:hypothetical protein